jgi:DNA-binding NarL/FixJ family response regulator
MTDSPLIRVLLVDDEPLAREMLREMLQGDPQVAIVGESCNGREALEAIRAHSPELLFLDANAGGGRLRCACVSGQRRNPSRHLLSRLTISMPFARLRFRH